MKSDGPNHYDLDVLRAIDLTEICGKLDIELDRQNRACCPIHNEDTPSFHINPANFFKCFGCGAGGDGIKLVQEVTGMDFKDAIKWLADMKNIQPGGIPGGLRMKSTIRHLPPIAPPPKPLSAPAMRAQAHLRKEMTLMLDGIANGGGFPEFCSYAEDREWDFDVITKLNYEGSLGATLPTTGTTLGLGFCYEYGTKIRYDLRSSRSCRWTAGMASENVWRINLLNPGYMIATIFEGETDLIAAASASKFGMDGYLAAPGASWGPSPKMITEIGMHRVVRLAFDNDTAGINATARLAAAFGAVTGCIVYAFDWRNFPTCGDIGDVLATMGTKVLTKALVNNWVKV